MYTSKKKIIPVLAAAALLFAAGCSTLNQVFGSPDISVSSVVLKSLDMEGITFSMDYAVSNPYPVGFSIQNVAADVVYDGSTKLTSLKADEGVTVASGRTQKNTMSFKIPYETILSMAKGLKSGASRDALPFAVTGKAALDLSAVPLLENKSLTLPFSKDFKVPIFKPSLSVSSPSLQMPTLSELKDSLVGGGMSLAKAASLASTIVSSKSLPEDIFDGVNLDMKFRFNINASNEGSASWNYIMRNCKLTSANAELVNLSPSSGNTISSSSGTIPMTATLNTLKSGRYIVQLINKKGENPKFTIDSGISFPGISEYMGQIPLQYSKEFAISSVGVSK